MYLRCRRFHSTNPSCLFDESLFLWKKQEEWWNEGRRCGGYRYLCKNGYIWRPKGNVWKSWRSCWWFFLQENGCWWTMVRALFLGWFPLYESFSISVTDCFTNNIVQSCPVLFYPTLSYRHISFFQHVYVLLFLFLLFYLIRQIGMAKENTIPVEG